MSFDLPVIGIDPPDQRSIVQTAGVGGSEERVARSFL